MSKDRFAFNPYSVAELGREFGFDPATLSPGAALAMAALGEALVDAEAMADRDALTPVLNRRAFLRELDRSAAMVERYGREAAVVYFDLDGFKLINDGFGHAVGDAVLLNVAGLLCDHVRVSDVVGRLGGDEFGVILVETPPSEAHAKARALARLIAGTPTMFDGRAHRVTAAYGVHVLRPREDAETAIARADEAMYAAKAPLRSLPASSA
jgi:diguanylate cyclase (GGDEF)-like protein